MRLVVVGVALGLALGCGGMSLDEAGTGHGASGGDTASGGTGGTTGGTGGTTGGTGGTTGGTGGTTGGTGGTGGTTGGTGGTTGGTGGTIIIMPGAGGTGGTTAGTGGMTAGTGGTSVIVVPDPPPCTLPLVGGSCDGLFSRYGFDPTQDQCVSFFYGGCDGNANNFATLEECQATCPPRAPAGCPATEPVAGEACMPNGTTCVYSPSNGCLCAVNSGSFCEQVDPTCTIQLKREAPPSGAAGACSGPDCAEEIVIPANPTCSCNGTWSCGLLL